MPLHIANFFECDRLSAVATAGLTAGMIVKVSDNGSGARLLTALADADTPVKGAYAIVVKELVDPYEVVASTANADTGIRISAINAGDNVLELRRGVKVEYTPDLLHASLDPSNAGTLPAVGAQLAIKGSKWCALGTAGQNAASATTPIGEVVRVFGSGATATVIIELL